MFFGDYDFNTEYSTQYIPKHIKKPYREKELDIANNCFKTAVLKTDHTLVVDPEHVVKTDDYCIPDAVHYKDAIELVNKKHPTIGEWYFQKPLKVDPIEYHIEYKPKSTYQVDYCKRGFCYSRNIVDKIDFKIRLDETHPLPDTSTQDAHRDLRTIAYRGIKPTESLRPVYDNSLKKKTEEILETKCGDTTYAMCHGVLGTAILQFKPYGEPRESPQCNRWGHPVLGGYTCTIRS